MRKQRVTDGEIGTFVLHSSPPPLPVNPTTSTPLPPPLHTPPSTLSFPHPLPFPHIQHSIPNFGGGDVIYLRLFLRGLKLLWFCIKNGSAGNTGYVIMSLYTAASSGCPLIFVYNYCKQCRPALMGKNLTGVHHPPPPPPAQHYLNTPALF